MITKYSAGFTKAAKEAFPKKRGLAAVSPEKRKEIAKLGGQAVAKDREYMAKLGRRGGNATSKDREHMSRIGKIGGKNSKKIIG